MGGSSQSTGGSNFCAEIFGIRGVSLNRLALESAWAFPSQGPVVGQPHGGAGAQERRPQAAELPTGVQVGVLSLPHIHLYKPLDIGVHAQMWVMGLICCWGIC